MDFSLSEEQVMLRDSVAKYVSENCGVERHRALTAAQRGYDEATWHQFAELGWLAVPFSEEQGGFDGGATDLMVVAEALGKGLVREPFLHTVVTCGGFLQRGNSEQQSQYIPSIIDGSAQWAFAFAEANSSYDLARLNTVARSDGGGYVLDGEKISVLNGDCADYLVVSARTGGSTGDRAGVSLFIVPGNAPGVSRETFVAVDGSNGAVIRFDQVKLDAAQLLGESGKGLPLIESVIDTCIVYLGGEALGAMQALLEATVEYTGTREQFGQAIGKFQALQHRMADMYLKVEETRSLLLNAAIQLDEANEEATQACAALKVKLAEAGRYVSQQAVQLHGGIGMTDELVVGHHYKRLMLLASLYGDESYYLHKYTEASAAGRAA